MNFIAAIQHATIGYGIRRKAWQTDLVLHLDNNHQLRWLESKRHAFTKNDAICLLYHGGDENLGGEAIAATDWETI